MKKFLWLLLASPLAAQVSNPSIIPVASEPATCAVLPMYWVAASNQLFGGNGSGVCQQVNTGGSGTFNALTGDATSTSTGGATTVKGLNGTILSSLATGVLKITTTTGVPSIAASSDIIALWTGTCSSSTFLRGDGSCAAGGGAVSSVSNSDSTLTISPTTGAVVASLNLTHANTWTANQTSANWIASTGFDISGAVTAGHYLRNNGTDYVDGAIQSADVPTLNQNTTGTAANLSGTPALPNGTTATTQTVADNTTKIATDAFVLANAGSSPAFSALTSGTNTTAAMLVGTGGSLGVTGSGTNAATSVTTAASTTNSSFSILAAANTSGSQAPSTISGFTINPSTGAVVLPGSITSTPASGNAGILSLASNTANPTLTAGDFSLLGAPSASVTAFAWQVPTATNASAGLLHVGADSANVSQLSVSQVAIADLSATGTPSSTTFLRGDNAWATPSGTGTVTSVGFTGGLISVGTPTTTPAFTVAGTSGGIPYFSSTSTWASSGALTSNVLVKGGGAGSAPTTSSVTDNATTVTTTDTGGYVAPVFVANGTTAGFMDFPQGSTSAAVAPCNTATSICWQAPTSVTSQLRVMAGAPATGFDLWTNSTGTMTETLVPATGNGPNVQTALIAGAPTYTAGTNVTSCVQATGYTNSNERGEVTIVGGTATTGTVCTVNFSTTLASAPGMCQVTQNGGAVVFSVGHGTPSATSFTITAGISVVSATANVDYDCTP